MAVSRSFVCGTCSAVFSDVIPRKFCSHDCAHHFQGEAMKTKSAAIVTIHNAAKMHAKGRKKIANWLRGRAALLEKHGDLMAKRFTARYLYK